MTLVGLTDNKDILFIQAFLILKQKGFVCNTINYIRTHSSIVPKVVKEYWATQNIHFETHTLPDEGRFSADTNYDQLEELFFIWYRDIVSEDNDLMVFLGGGNKIHASLLQKCAQLFGAKDLFHLFYLDSRGTEPKNEIEIYEAINQNKFLYFSLGAQSAWPVIKELSISKEQLGFSIRNITQRISSRTLEEINEYPFECINLLPPHAINWLAGFLSEDDKEFIQKLPKVELHCHLGGFATEGNLLNEVRKNADDSHSIGPIKNIPIDHQWPMIEYNISLDSYMKLGDNSGSYILKNTGCLKKQIKLLYEHLIEQNIKYAEIRCSPVNYENKIQNSFQVLETIQHEFENLMENSDIPTYCHVNLIIIATRSEDNTSKSINENLNQAIEYQVHNEGKECKVVGVDLAGFENIKTRAEIFESNFEPIHRAGIAVTIHAGENDQSEGIWQAVFKLSARRLGHALNLFQDQKLLTSVANRKIGVEMCPYANYQIYGFAPKNNCTIKYPLLQYLKAGIQVTVNTDNIGISAANLTDNYLLLSHMAPTITRMDVLQLIRNSLEQAFINNQHRNDLIKKFNQEIFNLIYSNIKFNDNPEFPYIM